MDKVTDVTAAGNGKPHADDAIHQHTNLPYHEKDRDHGFHGHSPLDYTIMSPYLSST